MSVADSRTSERVLRESWEGNFSVILRMAELLVAIQKQPVP